MEERTSTTCLLEATPAMISARSVSLDSMTLSAKDSGSYANRERRKRKEKGGRLRALTESHVSKGVPIS